jgi:pyocin large subunit-like protein
MALITNGFESVAQLNRHFGEHGHDFGASNPTEYEEMADIFLGGDKPEATHECARPGGAKLRYDPNSEAFGALDGAGIIRTYFKPVPCSSLPGAVRESRRQAGRCHRYANNLVYFKAECQK